MSSDVSSRLAAALDALSKMPGNDAARLRVAALGKAAAGLPAEAIALAEQAVAIDPDAAAYRITLGSLLLETGRAEEARAAFERATQLAPDDAVTWHWLGRAAHALDALDQAVDAQRRALAIDPDYRDAWRWLGFSCEFDGDLLGAIEAYERAQKLRYEPLTALRMALLAPYCAVDMAQLDWARQRVPRELQRLADSGFTMTDPWRVVYAVTGFYAYWGGEDRAISEAFAAFWRRVTPGLTWSAPHIGAWRPPVGRRPRIAYVTRYIYRHTVNRMFGGLARALPGLGFDVRVFSSYTGRAPERDAIEAACGKVIELPDDLAQARLLVADFEPDVVIYPELGLDVFTYFLAFARLAPLQITTWGHAATSGLSSIDVFLGSSPIDPPGAERFYSEELVRLDPPPVSYRPRLFAASPDIRAKLGLPEDARLYVCVQSLLKLQPDFDAVLAEILARDDKGMLVIVGSMAQQSGRILHRRLAAAIPDWQRRVRLIDRLPDEDFVAFLRGADAVIDSFGFAGGSTSYDLVSLGVPFVTLPGPASKGRAGYMLYRQFGIDDLIARDADHYIELALRLAQDRAWRQSLSARLLAAAPQLTEHERGYAVLAQWLHRRLADMSSKA